MLDFASSCARLHPERALPPSERIFIYLRSVASPRPPQSLDRHRGPSSPGEFRASATALLAPAGCAAKPNSARRTALRVGVDDALAELGTVLGAPTRSAPNPAPRRPSPLFSLTFLQARALWPAKSACAAKPLAAPLQQNGPRPPPGPPLAAPAASCSAPSAAGAAGVVGRDLAGLLRRPARRRRRPATHGLPLGR